MQPDTKVIIKATGKVGYVVSEDGDSLCVRVPCEIWPFPHYVYLDRKQVKRATVRREPTDMEEAPF